MKGSVRVKPFWKEGDLSGPAEGANWQRRLITSPVQIIWQKLKTWRVNCRS
jgi:hypothetical protein